VRDQETRGDHDKEEIKMKTICAAITGVIALAAGAWAQGAGPTDPQIAKIVVTANQ
jgi:putative membrane protein